MLRLSKQRLRRTVIGWRPRTGPRLPPTLRTAVAVQGKSLSTTSSGDEATSKTVPTLDGVTIVNDAKSAEKALKIMRSLPVETFHAWDTEVRDIDLDTQSPVGHGVVICASVYSGPNVDYGSGPRLWIDNMDGAEGVLQQFKEVLEDRNLKKVWHNYGFDRHVLYNHGIDCQGLGGDTMHMGRMWDTARGFSGGYSLEALTGALLQRRKVPMSELFSRPSKKKDGSDGKLYVPPVEQLQRDDATRPGWIGYSTFDAEGTWLLREALEAKLRDMPWHDGRSVYELYMSYIVPFAECLTDLEREGIRVDKDMLHAAEILATADRANAEKKFLEWASKFCPDASKMNVGSDTQKAHFLFAPCFKETKRFGRPVAAGTGPGTAVKGRPPKKAAAPADAPPAAAAAASAAAPAQSAQSAQSAASDMASAGDKPSPQAPARQPPTAQHHQPQPQSDLELPPIGDQAPFADLGPGPEGGDHAAPSPKARKPRARKSVAPATAGDLISDFGAASVAGFGGGFGGGGDGADIHVGDVAVATPLESDASSSGAASAAAGAPARRSSKKARASASSSSNKDSVASLDALAVGFDTMASSSPASSDAHGAADTMASSSPASSDAHGAADHESPAAAVAGIAAGESGKHARARSRSHSNTGASAGIASSGSHSHSHDRSFCSSSSARAAAVAAGTVPAVRRHLVPAQSWLPRASSPALSLSRARIGAAALANASRSWLAGAGGGAAFSFSRAAESGSSGGGGGYGGGGGSNRYRRSRSGASGSGSGSSGGSAWPSLDGFGLGSGSAGGSGGSVGMGGGDSGGWPSFSTVASASAPASAAPSGGSGDGGTPTSRRGGASGATGSGSGSWRRAGYGSSDSEDSDATVEWILDSPPDARSSDDEGVIGGSSTVSGAGADALWMPGDDSGLTFAEMFAADAEAEAKKAAKRRAAAAAAARARAAKGAAGVQAAAPNPTYAERQKDIAAQAAAEAQQAADAAASSKAKPADAAASDAGSAAAPVAGAAASAAASSASSGPGRPVSYSWPALRKFKIDNSEGIIEGGRSKPLAQREISIIGLGIPPVERTPSGWPAASTTVLRALAGKVEGSKPAYGTAYEYFGGGDEGKAACEALHALLSVSTIDTMLSNFIIPLQSMADGQSRIHCSLNLNTETGRLSARRPNLQNQPALEKDRYGVRKAFVAAPGKSLIVADYGQLELRLLAHLAKCKSMADAFAAGGDFHSRTAMGMFPHVKQAVDSGDVLLEWDEAAAGGAPPPKPLLKNVYAMERRKAKVLNFSIAYGKTAMGLASDWNVSLAEAKETLEAWYADRPEVRAWQRAVLEDARRDGAARTILGRYRHLPDISSPEITARRHAERAAINTPIQGSAADVAMLAMLKLWRNARLKEMGWRMLLQVHDEVILEGPTESAEEALPIVVADMGSPFGKPLSVDLVVDASIASNWAEGK